LVFPSPVFLFLFLPITLICYFVAGVKLRNFILLAFSLLFYAWGEGKYLLVMLYCISISWLFGLLVDNAKNRVIKMRWLWLGIGLLITPLFIFKYLNFVSDNLNLLFGDESDLSALHLPIGISFFTFQALSYLVDVYRSPGIAQRSILNLGLYISLFPQLIAGPIVRYHEICRQLIERFTSRSLFASGVERFIYGLAKKVLIANPLGQIADIVFSLPADSLGVTTAWIGITCYALQIYFDFSGYSDMAIGLGRMFGFQFSENFNYPYVSRSIREFWRRWHISLSTWFRDYVYIPLGGNRSAGWRVTRNLLIVFVLCGFWHGASWNFLIWGLLHGVFLALERSWFGRIVRATPIFFQHCYVLIVVLVGWVFFRSIDLEQSLDYLTQLVQISGSFTLRPAVAIEMDAQFWFAAIAGCFLSLPIFQKTSLWIQSNVLANTSTGTCNVLAIGKSLMLLILIIPVIFEIASGAYNPFIYFRF